MKYFLLICEAMADDALEELGGRTPLEVAKTPFMDELAQKGKIGLGAFLPPSLPAASEVSLFSFLGFDPVEFYTGLAPLEALAMGISLNDLDVVFRCDFVTVGDEIMVDECAGNISSGEALTLLKGLKEKIENPHRKLYHQKDFKNILLYLHADNAADLDETECSPASAIVGQKIAAWLPKGKAQRELSDLMNASKAVLENHEINRVRIDLKENPASQCWLWGQGRKPKMPSFKQRYGIEGGYFSAVNFARGLCEAVGLTTYGDLASLGSKPFNLFYKGAPSAGFKPKELKDKIKHIEEFDAQVVGPVFKKLAASSRPWRLAVATQRMRQHAPILLHGTGVEGTGASSFNEKNCAQSGVLFDPGHLWLGDFLKK